MLLYNWGLEIQNSNIHEITMFVAFVLSFHNICFDQLTQRTNKHDLGGSNQRSTVKN